MSGMSCGGGASGGSYGGAYGGGGGSGFNPGGIPAPGGPGGAFAASGVLVGKDVNYDGMIERREMGFIPNGGGAVVPGGGGGEDCADCVRTVTTYKTVQVPCTRNRYRTVNYQVPKTIPYQGFETVTKMRTVTKQVPKTIYVPTPEVVPYQVTVPITKYKTISVPQQKTICEPHSSIVTKTIPVVKAVNVCGPPPPCPPQPCP